MRQNGQTIPVDELLVTRLLADAGYHYFHWSPKPFPDWRDPGDYSATNAYAHWLIEHGVPYPYRSELFEGSPFVQGGIEEAHHQTTWCAGKSSLSSGPTPGVAGVGCCR